MAPWRESPREWLRAKAIVLERVVFQDRIGLGIFVGALLFFGFQWRIGFLITDNYTVANALVAVADGQLHITEFAYGELSSMPGLVEVDGRLYGRNYAHVFLALPVLWVLEGLDAVVDVRIAIAGGWSLLWIALGVLIDRGRTQDRVFSVIGSVMAVGLFIVNVVYARPLSVEWFPLLAIQVVSMLAGGFCGVLMYRILTQLHDRRVGLFAGVVVVVGTPVGFWAGIPKRHVLSACLVLVAVYGFTHSRTSPRRRMVRWTRAVSYAAVGVLAWLHAAEGLLLLAILVPLDVLTAEGNSRRDLAVIGVVFVVAMLPFLLTNQMIAGDPLEPPRVLPSWSGEPAALEPADPSAGGTTGGGGSGSGSGSGDGSSVGEVFAPVIAWVWELVDIVGYMGVLTSNMAVGLTRAWGDQIAYGQTLLRSGGLARAQSNQQAAINLTIIESMPIVGALTASFLLASQRLRARGSDVRTLVQSGHVQVDVFVAGVTLGFIVFYMPRLPLHSQWTVRYLVPIFPLLVYGVARSSIVHRLIASSGRLLGWAYAGVVLIGSQLLIVWLVGQGLLLGEMLQFIALIGLVIGSCLAVWCLPRPVQVASVKQGTGSILIGGAVGFTTVATLLSALGIFRNANTYALAISDVVSDILSIALF